MRSQYADDPGRDLSAISALILLIVVAVSALAFGAVAMGAFRSESSARLHVLLPPQVAAELTAESEPDRVDPMLTASTTAAAAPEISACGIQACARAYRSFRPSDCTFQPYEGARKLCTR